MRSSRSLTYTELTVVDRAADSLKRLQIAYAAAPRSGSITLKAGNEFALAGRHTDALLCYVRAATIYPHMLDARYRVGAALSNLSAGESEKDWWQASTGRRTSVVQAIKRMQEAAGGADRETTYPDQLLLPMHWPAAPLGLAAEVLGFTSTSAIRRWCVARAGDPNVSTGSNNVTNTMRCSSP